MNGKKMDHRTMATIANNETLETMVNPIPKLTNTAADCGTVRVNDETELVKFVDRTRETRTNNFGAVNATNFIRIMDQASAFIAVDLEATKAYLKKHKEFPTDFESPHINFIRFAAGKELYSTYQQNFDRLNESEFRTFVMSIVKFSLNNRMEDLQAVNNNLEKVNRETEFLDLIRIFFPLGGIYYLPRVDFFEQYYSRDLDAILDVLSIPEAKEDFNA